MPDKPTILIVDDESSNLDLLEQELEEDYDVVTAQDGIEALQKADACAPDLILLDVRMPGLNGLEVVRRLRASERHVITPVILLTAQAHLEDKVNGLDAGADDYITKPFEPDDLHARIRSALRIGRLQRELAQERNSLKEALAQLQAAEAQLVHSEKMAALGKLVAGVAHELNNPISFIYANMDHFRRYVGMVKTVCESASLAPDAADHASNAFQTLDRLIESCADGAQRIKRIVLGLRTFSRLDEVERKMVDLHEGIDSTLALLEHRLKDRITLHREYGNLPPVECYTGQLNQVIMNLVSNAIDAIPGHGDIWITTRVDDDQTVRVAVRDNGQGIAPEHRSHLFEPFFTTKPVGQGIGLGLSISYGIVEKHGGRIEVDSEIGQGSTFTIVLPIKETLER
ncbi:MAG: response regulator [Candidatus Latescibacteria bacterium]|nr:response regulator [Candidatus Latescibacterota bacterium]